MAKTLTIPWSDGNGSIVLTYTGEGNETVTISSTTDNLGETRSHTLTLRTENGSRSATLTIIQPTGKQILLDTSGNALRDASGKTLRVYPNQSVIPNP